MPTISCNAYFILISQSFLKFLDFLWDLSEVHFESYHSDVQFNFVKHQRLFRHYIIWLLYITKDIFFCLKFVFRSSDIYIYIYHRGCIVGSKFVFLVYVIFICHTFHCNFLDNFMPLVYVIKSVLWYTYSWSLFWLPIEIFSFLWWLSCMVLGWVISSSSWIGTLLPHCMHAI